MVVVGIPQYPSHSIANSFLQLSSILWFTDASIIFWFIAKPATTIFKDHGQEVEDVCHQIANEVVDLITIHFQTEEAANAVSSQVERRTSLVEASLGRNWQTGSFTGSFSKSQKDFNSSCEFTLSCMERLQHKVKSHKKRDQQSTAVDDKQLHQSLQKSLKIAESDTECKKQLILLNQLAVLL